MELLYMLLEVTLMLTIVLVTALTSELNEILSGNLRGLVAVLGGLCAAHGLVHVVQPCPDPSTASARTCAPP